MASFLLRRAAWMVVMFLSVTVVTFIIFFVIPSEDDQASLGRGGADVDVRTTVQIDGPLYEEYAEFLRKVLTQGSLGDSWVMRGQEVNEILVRAAPVTLSLVIGGAVLWMLIAIPTGLLAALRPRSALSRLTTVFVLVGVSAHPLWMGLMLSYIVGARLGLTPTGGYCEVFSPASNCGGPAQWAYHLLLPWFTFALMYAAIYTRMIRASTLETLNEDYVRTARAKGAPEWLVVRSHVLRNAMLPVVTMLGMDIALSLSATLFVETAYGLPGLGRLFATSLARRDFPVLLGITIYTTLVVIVVNFVIDVLYGVIDPRARADRRGEEAPRAAERERRVGETATQPAT
ncbi:MAG TPA: ABC transporter permease [Gaiellaceae bacterium]|nr:ABC transporter permease [Gaiellaceae bacterium]